MSSALKQQNIVLFQRWDKDPERISAHALPREPRVDGQALEAHEYP